MLPGCTFVSSQFQLCKGLQCSHILACNLLRSVSSAHHWMLKHCLLFAADMLGRLSLWDVATSFLSTDCTRLFLSLPTSRITNLQPSTSLARTQRNNAMKIRRNRIYTSLHGALVQLQWQTCACTCGCEYGFNFGLTIQICIQTCLKAAKSIRASAFQSWFSSFPGSFMHFQRIFLWSCTETEDATHCIALMLLSVA